jgi:hypothetical protein
MTRVPHLLARLQEKSPFRRGSVGGASAALANSSDAPFRRRVDELERRVAALEDQLTHPTGMPPLGKVLGPALLTAVIFVLAVVPSWLVVRDRWLEKPLESSLLNKWWYEQPFLRTLSLPPYFLIIFVCLLGLLILVLRSRDGPLVAFSNLSFGVTRPGRFDVSAAQLRSSRILLITVAIAEAAIVVISLLRRRVPGAEVAAVLILYGLAWVLREVPLANVRKAWGENRRFILALLLFHGTLVASLASAYSPAGFSWIHGLLLALAVVNLLPFLRRVRPIFWVVSLALVLYTLNINAWWFASVGDEYAFLGVARRILELRSLSFIGSHLFDGQTVYGTHPFISTLIQVIFLKLFGVGGFGWRFSNLYLSALAVGLFYLFFKAFVPRRIALLAALFLACSHFLMSFGKIGYNNLQALFAMSLALAASAWAVQTRRQLAYVSLGLAVGFCFYVFPAALYIVPLPFFLILLYDPPTSKEAAVRWGLVLVSVFLFLSPLFFQPAYWWQSKQQGTFLSNAQLMSNPAALIQNLGSNLLYALLSFLYTVEESHFVAVSYVDPLSAALVAIGIAYLLRSIAKNRFVFFWLAGFGAVLFLAGASHGGHHATATRMFLLLPFLVLFAAVGLSWVANRWQTLFKGSTQAAGLVSLLVLLVIALNLYQAYPLSRWRMERYQELGTLWLRTLMRAQGLPDPGRVSVFLSEPGWSILPLADLYRITYGLPASLSEVVEFSMTGPALPETARPVVSDRRSLVMIEPQLDEEWKRGLEQALQDLGKTSCDMKTLRGSLRFKLWASPDDAAVLCR